MKKYITLALLFVIVGMLQASAMLIPPQIGNNMVLQQNTDACLWGWVKPKTSVKIKCSWSNSEIKAKADDKGAWKVTVATPAGSYTPQTITIEGDKQTVTLTNVLIGEVWVASGQSNMEMPIKGFPAQFIDGSDKVIAFANQYKNKIRMATIPRNRTDALADTVRGDWKVCDPENVPDFSAVAYFFAESLNRLLDVPVGIIHTSWGGTFVPEWMPKESTDKFNDIKADIITKRFSHAVNKLFNGMVHPLANYTIRGFIWNQGESDAIIGDRNYHNHFAEMVKAWRTAFGQGELPMYCVEIPGHSYDDPNKCYAALERELQWKGAALAGNCDVVSIIDCMRPDQANDIHGSIKQPIGQRLAWIAAAKTYGMTAIPHLYPRFEKMEVKGNTATLHFTNTQLGFTPNHDLQGFEVAGDDKVFYPAKAGEDWSKHTINLSCDKVKEIKAVRYCFKNWAIGTVHNSQWLPLVPFRTDDWEITPLKL
ncbi:MAG: sialate O-acetylesterase [Sodaliphilus sp.]|nr:sialate O-acetylesterase [Sodaliphilus sp.]